MSGSQMPQGKSESCLTYQKGQSADNVHFLWIYCHRIGHLIEGAFSSSTSHGMYMYLENEPS